MANDAEDKDDATFATTTIAPVNKTTNASSADVASSLNTTVDVAALDNTTIDEVVDVGVVFGEHNATIAHTSSGGDSVQGAWSTFLAMAVVGFFVVVCVVGIPGIYLLARSVQSLTHPHYIYFFSPHLIPFLTHA